MSPEPIARTEFEGYIRRHESDQYAHASMRHDLRNDIVGSVLDNSARIRALERWQQRIIGGLMFASVLLGSGAVAAVVEFSRR